MGASLDPNTIASLIGKPTAVISQMVEAKVAKAMHLLQAFLPEHSLRRPTVTYDLRGHHAGYARSSNNNIRLNLDLLLNETTRDEILNETIPHEVAHIVQRQIWPNSKSHGKEWKRLMWYLGLEPTRCHTMQTKAARKRTPQARYAYYCSCPNRTHFISQTRHNRIQRGTQTYKCKYCRKEIYPDYDYDTTT